MCSDQDLAMKLWFGRNSWSLDGQIYVNRRNEKILSLLWKTSFSWFLCFVSSFSLRRRGGWIDMETDRGKGTERGWRWVERGIAFVLCFCLDIFCQSVEYCYDLLVLFNRKRKNELNHSCNAFWWGLREVGSLIQKFRLIWILIYSTLLLWLVSIKISSRTPLKNDSEDLFSSLFYFQESFHNYFLICRRFRFLFAVHEYGPLLRNTPNFDSLFFSYSPKNRVPLW